MAALPALRAAINRTAAGESGYELAESFDQPLQQ
jgi:hypothetical protein